jgi:DNA-binding response OmpR family regulator
MMPVMDGLQVCQELKKTSPAVPVILLTARDDMMTRAAAMELGVHEFLTKPVNNQDLINRLRSRLRHLQWDQTADQLFSTTKKSSGTPGPNK